MKRLLFLSVALILLSFTSSMGSSSDLFRYDVVALNNQMTQLDQLEVYVSGNTGITLDQLMQKQSADPNFSGLGGVSGLNLVNEKTLGIPGFCWGCGLGVLGVLIVFVTNKEDKQQVRASIFGCIISSLVAGGGLFLGRNYY